jgi:two-component system capsular synthesis response regulator RcsB
MKFLIADDHPIILVALAEMLETAFPGRIAKVDTAGDGSRLLRRLDEACYDYLVMDLEMPAPPKGIPLLQAVRRARPSLKILVYTGNPSPCLALAALEHGATAYVSKGSGAHLAIDAIRAVVDMRTFVDPSIDVAAAREHPWNRLSPSERSVVLALAKGENMQSLALNSRRSYKTVSTHKYNALRKLGLRPKAEIGVFLNHQGLGYLFE